MNIRIRSVKLTQTEKTAVTGANIHVSLDDMPALGEILAYAHNADLSERARRIFARLAALVEGLDSDTSIADEETRRTSSYAVIRRAIDRAYADAFLRKRATAKKE